MRKAIATAIASLLLSTTAGVARGAVQFQGGFVALGGGIPVEWTLTPHVPHGYDGSLTLDSGLSPNVLFSGGSLTDLPAQLSLEMENSVPFVFTHGYPIQLSGLISIIYEGAPFQFDGNTIDTGANLFTDYIAFGFGGENFGAPFTSDIFSSGITGWTDDLLHFSGPLFSQTESQAAYLLSGDLTASGPEPATWAMMLSGFFALGGVLRGRRSRFGARRLGLSERDAA